MFQCFLCREVPLCKMFKDLCRSDVSIEYPLLQKKKIVIVGRHTLDVLNIGFYCPKI